MTEELWTQGPWTSEPVWAGYTAIRGASGELVFGISMGDSDECQTPETCEANLRMCVAAPEIYSQLEAALTMLTKFHGYPLDNPGIMQITAALAKANQAVQEGE